MENAEIKIEGSVTLGMGNLSVWILQVTQPHSVGKMDGRRWAGSAAGAEGGAIRVASSEHGG